MTGIPDGITPVSAWRVWRWAGRLRSLNGAAVWLPNEPLHAVCQMNTGVRWQHLTVRMLESWSDPRIGQPVQAVGSGLSYAIGAPPKRALRELYDGARSNMVGPHDRRLIPTPSVYDEDRGEHFVPFGRRSRIVVTREVTPELVADDGVPAERCSCGIYALKNRERALEYGGQGSVLGRVALWGRTVVGEDGYRAEFAYPQSFFIDEPPPGLEAYGVPIFKLSELEHEPPAKARRGLFG